MGLASRRRYRWTRGRISDYWDEVFTADGLDGRAALDDESAFIASLGSSRSDRMRDVLATIQADQDAIIRAGSRGALVVDGGPGTGKTVVALHRTAYLLYSDPRIGRRGGGVLFVGPHRPTWPTSTTSSRSRRGRRADLHAARPGPRGATAAIETDPEAARLKSSGDIVQAIEAAVGLYERAARAGDDGRDAWADIWLTPRTGPRRSRRPNPALRTTRRAIRCGRSC